MQQHPDSQPEEEAPPTADRDAGHGVPSSDAPVGDAPIRRKGLIPRELLDDHAVFVVRRLQSHGHEAYLVGGCVRDLLAGLEPKDFDLATDAKPNRIKRLFRSARVIGRRFRLVHIRFPGDHIIETATFRGDPKMRQAPDVGPPDDEGGGRRRNWRESAENIFGTAPEDAHRRDFTMNALFYDPVRDEVIDWVGGLDDMSAGVVRSIGAPIERIIEDPVRMLRAVHFACRLDFKLEPELAKAVRDCAGRLEEASQARLYIELVKMLRRGRARSTFSALHELGILKVWLPELCTELDQPQHWPTEAGTHEEASHGEPEDIPVAHATWNLLGATDRYGLAAHSSPEPIALAVLFGPWILDSWARTGGQAFGAFVDHFDEVFRPLALRMSVPRAVTHQVRDMLWLLPLLRHPPRNEKSRRRILHRAAFFDALLLLELDLDSRDAETDVLDQWRALAEEAGVKRRSPRARPARRRGRRGGGRHGGRGRQRSGREAGQGEAREEGGRRRRGRRRKGRPSDRDADANRRPSRPPPEAGAWTPPPPDPS